MASRRPTFTVRSLTVVCTDRAKSEQFYGTVLGGVIVPTDNGIGRRFRIGSLVIDLLSNASERSPSEFPTHAMPMLWLEADDLPAAVALFERHAVTVLDPGDGQFVMVADPDGLPIEVWQASRNGE